MTTDITVQDDTDNGDRLVTVPTVRTEFGELSGWALVPTGTRRPVGRQAVAGKTVRIVR